MTWWATSLVKQRRQVLGLSQASVSYKEVPTPEALTAGMVDRQLPANITPQVATLLDETPLPLIVGAVEEVARHTHCPAKTLWKHLVQWAHDLQSPRAVWA